ncbi:MAG: peptide chain release factor N(5)-glutamine methyltransferase [Salibacteraceae bacterium]
MNHASLRQYFYSELSAHYLQGELQSLYHWCVLEIEGWNRAQAYLHNDDVVATDRLNRWKEVIAELQNKRPIQYIFNKSTFFDLDLFVDERVLIPRPETEELVEWVLEEESSLDLRVLDVGTGSGCIALALKSARPYWEVSACDVSEDALAVARQNAAKTHLPIRFALCDLRQSNFQLNQVDVVVSNPPYIPNNLNGSLAPNVQNHEPHLALFAPENEPFYFFKRIADVAKKAGVKRVYFETHASDVEELSRAVQSFWSGLLTVKNDLNGKPRFLKLH